jgi:hypothetical protein
MPELDLKDLGLERETKFDLSDMELLAEDPDLTLGRALGRFGSEFIGAPGRAAAAARSLQLAYPDPEEMAELPSQYTFWEPFGQSEPPPSKRTALDDHFEEMDPGARSRIFSDIENMKADGYPEREAFNQSVIKEIRDQRKQIISNLKGIETATARGEKYKKSSGYIEDVFGGLGFSASTMPVYQLNPIIGAMWTYAQLHGAKIQEFEQMMAQDPELDISPEKMVQAATFSAGYQTPIETLVSIKQLSKIMKLNGSWTKFIKDITEVGLVEGIEALRNLPSNTVMCGQQLRH